MADYILLGGLVVFILLAIAGHIWWFFFSLDKDKWGPGDSGGWY